MDDVAERVASGAALLDEKRPGWWREIDLATLDIGDTCNCVVGQLIGGSARRRLDGLPAVTGSFEYAPWPWKFGMNGDPESLTAEWKRVISGRRAARAAS